MRLWYLDSQHTMCKRGVDVIGPKVTRQGHAILEIPDATGAAPQQTLALALLDFASHDKFIAVQLHVDVLGAHTGQLNLDHVGGVSL
ncbi:hypothetical protein AWB91_02550 [Mycobacterium paraense]|uniref:Uncharacterized protein n=1 Tax=Mycobacterium paraense TaxID=767916 RepID=A0A1X2A6E2_9MYCO|nr:hypothetical protein AWB91_02550 [Mycobacterium paraense]ORW41726.1 hypothetical protein AWB90_20815 [Mycobacterium paraense]ORW42600.1 hypothetical protein AWB88_00685 [Mycobacterium paraense]